jgi:hypothetical protein
MGNVKVLSEGLMSPGRDCSKALATFLLLVMIPPSNCLQGTERERISCFLLGSVLPNICPLPGYFTEDPLFTYESDPQQAGLTLEERRRLDRLYFPRNRRMLLDKFDMVFTFDPRLEHFTAGQFGDLEHAFKRDGMPSFWSFGPSYTFMSGTVLDDVLPIGSYDGYYHRPWRVSFREDKEPLFTPFIALGMERVPGEAYGWMKPRAGSTTWADMVPYKFPWLVSWRPGGTEAGLSWVLADEFNMVWWALVPETRGTNPYAIDLMTNLILYSLGKPLISDIILRHQARHLITTYGSIKITVLSMLEWADSFGANTIPLSGEITEIDRGLPVAVASYLEQDYTTSMAIMEGITTNLSELSVEAVALKDEALFWVFLSEWMIVTSVAAISGTSVWGLMVRRRMYKVVASTRTSRYH